MAPSTSPTRTPVPAWTRWLPAGLLVVGALGQGLRVQLLDASSWGGGATFAMFADIDHAGTRHVTLELLVEGRWVAAELPPGEADAALHLRHLPSDDRAADIADAALRSGWASGADGVWRPAGTPVDGTVATAARVRLWTVDIRDGLLVPSVLSEAEVGR